MKRWDTHQLAASQQFGYWREVLCEAFTALDSVPRAQQGFGSTVTLHEVDQINAVELASFSQEVVRGHGEIRRRSDAYFFANLQVEGRCGVEQDCRRIEVGPGRFYLVDTTRPYRLSFAEPFRALSFRIPHAQLLARLPPPKLATAVAVDAASALGGVTASHMQSLMRGAAELSPTAASGLAGILTELIAMSVREAVAPNAASRAATRQAFRQSIVHYVETHTADPQLSVAAVATRFRVSPRYVHGVFAEQHSTFAQTVLTLRLQAAARALCQAGASVTTVALLSGFGDLSYFGRTFRQRYGCSPREWRQRR